MDTSRIYREISMEAGIKNKIQLDGVNAWPGGELANWQQRE